MSAIVSQITIVPIIRLTVCSGADQRKYQTSMSLAFVRGIHHWLVVSLHKGPEMQKILTFGDIITNFSPCSRYARRVWLANVNECIAWWEKAAPQPLDPYGDIYVSGIFISIGFDNGLAPLPSHWIYHYKPFLIQTLRNKFSKIIISVLSRKFIKFTYVIYVTMTPVFQVSMS